MKTVIASLLAAATFVGLAQASADLKPAEQLSAQAFAAARAGDLQKAVALHQEAYALAERILGASDARLADFLRNIARTRAARDQGDPRMADPRHWRLLQLQNQGAAARDGGHYTTALALYTEALPLAEALYREEETQVLMLLDGLGELHQALGDHAAALRSFSRIVRITERAYGAESMRTANARHSLANQYRLQGEYDKALELFGLHLDAVRKHPEGAAYVDVFRVHIAHVYRDMGRHEEALALYERGLAALEERIGVEHEETVETLSGMARLYSSMGRHEEALAAARRGLAIRQKLYGARHLLATKSLAELAAVQLAAGQDIEALKTYGEVVALREETLGPEHELTRLARRMLAGARRSEAQMPKR
jgi:tetratricopeptide (TPR) repeat protein